MKYLKNALKSSRSTQIYISPTNLDDDNSMSFSIEMPFVEVDINCIPDEIDANLSCLLERIARADHANPSFAVRGYGETSVA